MCEAHEAFDEQGEELRKQIGAAAYIECSSKTQQVIAIDKNWKRVCHLEDKMLSCLMAHGTACR